MKSLRLVSLLVIVALIIGAIYLATPNVVGTLQVSSKGMLLIVPPSQYNLKFVAVSKRGDRTTLPLHKVSQEGIGTAFIITATDIMVFAGDDRKKIRASDSIHVYIYGPKFKNRMHTFQTASLESIKDTKSVKYLPVRAIFALADIIDRNVMPMDQSVLTLQDFSADDRVCAELKMPVRPADEISFIYSPDWKDKDNFTFIAAYGGAIATGVVLDSKKLITSISATGSSGKQSLFSRRNGKQSAVTFAGESFVLPRITSSSIYKAGFLGITPNTVLTAFSSALEKEIYFTDSFMRVEETGVWSTVSGRWEIFGMKNPDESSNPFSLAFSSIEHPSFQKFYNRGSKEQTGLGARLIPVDNGASFEVTFILEGSPAELAGLKTGDKIKAINEKPVVNMSSEDLKQYISEHMKEEIALRVERNGEETICKIALGTFDMAIKRYETSRIYIGSGQLGDTGILLAGESFWSDCLYSVSFKAYGGGSLGSIFDWRGNSDYYLIRWNSDSPANGKANTLELVCVRSSGETILSTYSGGFLPGQYYRLTVDYRGDEAIVLIDGTQVIRTPLPDKLCGKVGLYVGKSEAVIFDDVYVSTNDPTQRKVKFTEAFVTDRLMKTWADQRYDWENLSGSYLKPVNWDKINTDLWNNRHTDDILVNRQHFFGKPWIEITKPSIKRAAYLGICANPEEGLFGYSVNMKMNGECTLYEGKKKLATSVYAGSYLPARVILRKGEGRIELSDGERVFLSAEYEKDLDAGRSWMRGFDYPFGKDSSLSTGSPTTTEYNFDSVPVEWEIADGEWGTMNRWVCTPIWSYFGGKSDYLGAIWNKATCSGNMELDFYVGFAMPSYTRMPAEKPADLGITLFGDGKNPTSGCSILLGANMNSTNLLFINGKLTNVPDYRFNTSLDDLDMAFHQRWIHVTAVVIDGMLTVTAENKVVLRHDVSKIAAKGGRIAIWTLDNSILVARAHVSSTTVQGTPILTKNFKLGSVGPFNNVVDGKIQCAIEKSGSRNGEDVFHISPIWGGGANEFGINAGIVDLSVTPALQFDYSYDGAPSWDMYFKYDGKTYKIGLFGSEENIEAVQYLGNFTRESAGQEWNTARANIAAMLSEMLNCGIPQKITDLRFAVYRHSNHIQAGYNQNDSNASLYISGFQFVPAPPQDTAIESATIQWGFRGLMLVIRGKFAPSDDPLKWKIVLDGYEIVKNGEAWYNKSEGIAAFPVLPQKDLKDLTKLTLKNEAGALLHEGDIGIEKGSDRIVRITEIFEPGVTIYENFNNNSTGYKETSDESNRWKMGFQTSVSATHLARMYSGDPTLGRSLRVLCTEQAQVFGVSFPFNKSINSYPIMQFDYCFRDVKYVSLLLHSGSAYSLVNLMSKPNSMYSSNSDSDRFNARLLDDGNWHTASIVLTDIAKDMSLKLVGNIPQAIDFGDFDSWLGHFDGAYYYLDNIRFLPVLKPESLPKLLLVAPMGKTKVSIEVVTTSKNKTSDVTRTTGSDEFTFTGGSYLYNMSERLGFAFKDGCVTINIKVSGANGSLQSTHFDYVIDTAPPIYSTSRFRFYKGKMPWIRVEFEDSSGIDSSKLQVFWNGTVVPQADLIEFLSTGDAIIFKLPESYGDELTEAGTATLELKGISDGAGYTFEQPLIFTLGSTANSIKRVKN